MEEKYFQSKQDFIKNVGGGGGKFLCSCHKNASVGSAAVLFKNKLRWPGTSVTLKWRHIVSLQFLELEWPQFKA